MAFRYMNPGLVELLDSDCVATQVTGSQYSRTGVAFKQTKLSAGVTLPNFAEGDDFWARFDVYIPNNYCKITCFLPRTERAYIELAYNPSGNPVCNVYSAYRSSGTYTLKSGSATEVGVRLGDINTFLLHAIYGSSGNFRGFDFFINGVYINGRKEVIPYSTSYEAKVKLYSTISGSSGVHPCFSNVIFSNEEISAKEKVIALPVSSTLTDMTAGASGIYIADTVNQQLLQSVDVSELAEKYGVNSAVTGIQIVGNPAYATGTGITTLKSLSKSGGVVSEKGSYSLSDDTSAVVMDGWGLSGVTLADLQNMQFGWKVGE